MELILCDCLIVDSEEQEKVSFLQDGCSVEIHHCVFKVYPVEGDSFYRFYTNFCDLDSVHSRNRPIPKQGSQDWEIEKAISEFLIGDSIIDWKIVLDALSTAHNAARQFNRDKRAYQVLQTYKALVRYLEKELYQQ